MNIKEIKKLANLARLEVSESRLEAFSKDMDGILGFVDEIQKVEIGKLQSDDELRVNVFREDVVAPVPSVHDLVEASSSHQDRFVKVPKVL